MVVIDGEKYQLGPARVLRMDDEGQLHELSPMEAAKVLAACEKAATLGPGLEVTGVDPLAGVVTVKVAA